MMNFIMISLCTAMAACTVVSQANCQGIYPKSPSHPVKSGAPSHPVAEGPTFQETVDFINSKINAITSPVLTCGKGYNLRQRLSASTDKPNFVELHVQIIPVDDDTFCKGLESFSTPFRRLYGGVFDPSSIAIGSIAIENDHLAKANGEPLDTVWKITVPLATPNSNFTLVDEKLGRHVATEFKLYLNDQATAERVKKALIALAKLCGAKEEPF